MRVRTAFSLWLIILILGGFSATGFPTAFAQPSWPLSWIEIDWDRNENGASDDWRDVEYAYFEYDEEYLYLKLHCYAMPGCDWPSGDARYKWFIDLDGYMYYSGGNIYDAEYVIFVEDTNDDGVGELFLVSDANSDNNFGEYEPWPPPNYLDYAITDPTVGDWRIVSPNQIEMYINWTSIEAPTSYQLFWATDQQNPNLDQGPTTDRPDEEAPIIIHNVVAVSQTPTPTIVNQGENVSVQVVVENEGTQAETFNVTCYFNNTAIDTKLVTNLATGQQQILTFEWNTTGLPEGAYSITAWADSGTVITETNEEDNWCTSPAILTIEPPLSHDVAAVSQVPDKYSAIQGETIDINVTVSNLGDFNEDFNVTCFYGDNSIDYQTVTGLSLAASTSLIFTWNTTGVTPGTYYVRAMADSSGNIVEIDEVNNNCTSFETITIYSLGDMGALFVDKVKTDLIAGEEPPVVGYPTTFEFTILVTNIGGSPVSNIVVNETISSDVGFITVGSPSQGIITTLPPPKIIWNVGTLAPGANATLTFQVGLTPTSPSLYYLNHKEDLIATGIDALTSTPVSDVGDTDTTITAIVRDVAAVDQVPTSTIVSQGDTLAIDVTVKNLGNVSATFDVACYNDSSLIGIMRLFNLAAGDETIISFPWDTTGIPPGTYSITAEADSSNEILESDETNNNCTSPASVQIVVHDIAIVSQKPSPTTVTEGEIVTIEVVVTNEGSETESFTVSCYYNETFLETKTVTALAPGTNTAITFLWDTSGESPGLYYITAGASAVPGEKDTDDNACLSTTTVTIGPCSRTLTVSSSIGGDTSPTSGSHDYPCDSIVEVMTMADECYVFDHWELDGSPVGNDNPITVYMGTDHSIHAVFTPLCPYTLTIQVEGTGTTTPVPGDHEYSCGEYASITAIETNPACWVFDHWKLDGTPMGSSKSIEVQMDDDHVLRAVFIYNQETCVGGASVTIKSPTVDAWVLLNSILVACVSTTAVWTKRHRKHE
jgi:uncharacterized repeat protein (TIGR01451 family)